MSRIQEILRKAEREGAVHRTRALTVDTPASGPVLVEPTGHGESVATPAAAPVGTRGVETPAVSRTESPVVNRVEPPLKACGKDGGWIAN